MERSIIVISLVAICCLHSSQARVRQQRLYNEFPQGPAEANMFESGVDLPLRSSVRMTSQGLVIPVNWEDLQRLLQFRPPAPRMPSLPYVSPPPFWPRTQVSGSTIAKPLRHSSSYYPDDYDHYDNYYYPHYSYYPNYSYYPYYYPYYHCHYNTTTNSTRIRKPTETKITTESPINLTPITEDPLSKNTEITEEPLSTTTKEDPKPTRAPWLVHWNSALNAPTSNIPGTRWQLVYDTPLSENVTRKKKSPPPAMDEAQEPAESATTKKEIEETPPALTQMPAMDEAQEPAESVAKKKEMEEHPQALHQMPAMA